MFLILFSVLGVSFTIGPSPQDFYIFLGIIPNFSLSWLSYLLTSVAENKHGCNSLILSFFSMVIPKCWSANGALFISHIHCKSPFSPQNSSKSFFFFFTILLDMCACSQDLTNIDSFALLIFPNVHHVNFAFYIFHLLTSSLFIHPQFVMFT